jgi:Copper transport outer membrane protein, MctB
VIDFRYHLVSIIAVFLALAIGIVLGTTALSGPVTRALTTTTGQLQSENENLRSTNSVLQQQLNGANGFAQTAAPQLLAHQLDGQRVVLVTAPGAPSQVPGGLTTTLKQAGATVTGQIALQDKFFDTSASTQSYLDSLAQNLAAQAKPSAVTLADGTPAQHAAQVLANAILTKSDPGAGGTTGSAGGQTGNRDTPADPTVLSGFGQAGFLTASAAPSSRATLALVITPANPQTGATATAANQALTAVATALGSASMAVVMAGPSASADPGGAIAALRGSNSAQQVSSVDDADTAIGQVTVAWAFSRQLSSHQVGSYGTGAGASGIAPSPPPTPAPSPTASPSVGAAAARGSK